MKSRLNSNTNKDINAREELPACMIDSATPAQANTSDASACEVYVNDPETGARACLLPESHTPRPNMQFYRLYFSDNIKAVCKGDPSCLVEETAGRISPPKLNDSSISYYWRVDTVLATGEVLEGRVWSS